MSNDSALIVEIDYDGSPECIAELQSYDLYINEGKDGTHLCEMISLNSCEDWGVICPGDKVLITEREVYIKRG